MVTTVVYRGQKYRVTERVVSPISSTFDIKPWPKGNLDIKVLEAARQLREQRAVYRYKRDQQFLRACGIQPELRCDC